jgi:hypothetical protein
MRGCRVGIELHTLSPISRAEADGNRTRLGALAPTPVLKTGGPTRNPDASAKQPTRGISMRVHTRVRPGYRSLYLSGGHAGWLMRGPSGSGVPGERVLSMKRGDDVVRAGDGGSEVRALLSRRRSLDVDKDDLKRYRELSAGSSTTCSSSAKPPQKANGRDVIEPFDLPIAHGLQEGLYDSDRLDEDVELAPILDDVATRPPLDLSYSQDTEARLPAVLVGGPDRGPRTELQGPRPQVKNPCTSHWERAFRIFDLLV